MKLHIGLVILAKRDSLTGLPRFCWKCNCGNRGRNPKHYVGMAESALIEHLTDKCQGKIFSTLSSDRYLSSDQYFLPAYYAEEK